MLEKHPSEYEIQEYLSGDLNSGRETQIAAHLRLCEECRETLSLYGKLNTTLKETMDLDLGPEFTNRTLQFIEKNSTHTYLETFRDIGLSSMGILLSIVSMIYFIDMEKLSTLFKRFDFQILIGLLEKLDIYLRKAHMDLQMILISLTALLLVMGIDHLLYRHRDKLRCYLKTIHTM